MRPRFVLFGLLAALVVAFIVLSFGDGLIVDLLWFDSLGYRDTRLRMSVGELATRDFVRSELRAELRAMLAELDDES